MVYRMLFGPQSRTSLASIHSMAVQYETVVRLPHDPESDCRKYLIDSNIEVIQRKLSPCGSGILSSSFL